MDLQCPGCQRRLTIGDQFAGQMIKCPVCGGMFLAPALPAKPVVPAPLATPPALPVAPPVAPPIPALRGADQFRHVAVHVGAGCRDSSAAPAAPAARAVLHTRTAAG
jgi:hypothetical protein